MLAAAVLAATLAAPGEPEVVARLNVPDLASLVRVLAAGPWAPLVPVLMPEEVGRAVGKRRSGGRVDGVLLLTGGEPEFGLRVDLGHASGEANRLRDAMVETLRAAGWTIEVTGATSVARLDTARVRVAAAGGVVTASSRPELVEPGGQGGGPAALTGPASLVIELPAVYRWLAARREATSLVGWLGRLGLGSGRRVEVRAALEDPGRPGVHAVWTQSDDLAGVLAALHPAVQVPPVVPARGPRAEALVGVRPARLWAVIAKLWSYESPLGFTVFDSQLASLERQVGKTLAADILGDDPQLLRAVASERPHEREIAVELGVRDARGAEALAGAVAGVLVASGAGVSVRQLSLGGSRGLELRGPRGSARVAFGAESVRLSVGDSEGREITTGLPAPPAANSATAVLCAGWLPTAAVFDGLLRGSGRRVGELGTTAFKVARSGRGLEAWAVAVDGAGRIEFAARVER